MADLRVGDTCPGCGLPHWTLTIVDFARGSCGRCGYVVGRDIEAVRQLKELQGASSSVVTGKPTEDNR